MIWRGLIAAGLMVCAGAAKAVDLAVPAQADQVAQRSEVVARVAIPVAPYRDGFLQTRDAGGTKTVTAFKIDAPDLRAVGLIAPIEAQLEAAGFRTLLRCETFGCGGFDFRFAIEVLPPPAMFVDLGEFAYISAVSEEGGTFVTVLASRTLDAGFLQITQVVAEGGTAGAVTPAPSGAVATRPILGTGDIARDLEVLGHVVLGDLTFATGTTNLSDGGYASLEALGRYLTENPSRRIALVGHTDASGGLDVNLRVSKARATAVRARLIGSYGVAPDQVEAEGVGYLSPKGSNLSEDGRAANRRVEAVIISTE